MTISIAWRRKIGLSEELVMVTDSRLRFGGHWDCCPKILPLPRNDSAICFSGHTDYAYPIMLQFLSVIEQHPKIKSRALDLVELKGHLLRVMNNMVSQIEDLPRGEVVNPSANFLFAGWSWRHQRYFVWLLHFDFKIKRFTFRQSRQWAGGNGEKFLAYTGDYQDDFKSRLVELLRSRGKLQHGGFDMEPFEVLREMIKEGSYTDIGGAPQLIKIYRHSNCVPHAIYWPNKESKKISLMGRPLLDYETSKYLVLDPYTLAVEKHPEFSHPPVLSPF